MSATIQLGNIAPRLKDRRNWVCWKLTDKGKEPFIAGTNKHAKPNDASTWTTFDAAVSSVSLNGKQGTGFAPGNSGIIGIDIDGCRNPETEEIAPWADEILDLLSPGTSVEITPSEFGIRAWVTGVLPTDERVFKIALSAGFGNKVQVEFLGEGRYGTVTGNPFYEDTGDVEPCDLAAVYELSRSIHRKYSPSSVSSETSLTHLQTESVQIKNDNGPVSMTSKYELLMRGTVSGDKPFHIEDDHGNYLEYDDKSAADMAFANASAFHHIDVSVDQRATCVRQDYLSSNLCRAKWANREEDFRRLTIAKAIAQSEKAKIGNAPLPIAARDLEDSSESDLPLIFKEEDRPAEEDEFIGAADDLADDKWFFKGRLLNFPNAALYGITGDIIRKLHPQTESHPAGNLLDLLISLGSIIGRGPHYVMDGTRHGCNNFGVRVGKSSKSRKGTGGNHIRRIVGMVDGGWSAHCNISGLGSGEVMVHSIRDAQTTFDAKGKPQVDHGVSDKRLHISEGEFASVLVLLNKRDSRLSVNIRDGWDGQPLRNITKGDGKQICREPHITIMADSTSADVSSMTFERDKKNGCVNRFLWCLVERTKKLPHGGEDIDWMPEIIRLINVVNKASLVRRVFMTANARRVWTRQYDKLSADIPGVLGSVTSRGEAHCLRLALLLAILDEAAYEVEKGEPVNDGDPEVSEYRCHIDVCHLKAAFAFWEYCFDSARLIFGGVTNDQGKILDFLATGPKSLPEIVQHVFHKHRRSAEVKSDLERLAKLKKIAPQDDGSYKAAG